MTNLSLIKEIKEGVLKDPSGGLDLSLLKPETTTIVNGTAYWYDESEIAKAVDVITNYPLE